MPAPDRERDSVPSASASSRDGEATSSAIFESGVDYKEALHLSEERFRLLVDTVKDYAIFLLDPTGVVVSWNAGAERIKGYRAPDIIGQHFSRFYPEEDIQAAKPDKELEIAERDGRLEDEGWRVRKDGSRFWANVVITALRDAHGRLVGFAKVTRDLTERRRAEQERVHLATEEAARQSTERFMVLVSQLHAVAGSLAAARTPQQVAQTLVDQSVQALRAASAVLVRANGGDLELVADCGLPEAARAAWRRFPLSDPTPLGDALRTRRAQWIGSPAELLRRYPNLRAMPAGASAVTLPLVVQDRVLGAVGFRFDGPRTFAPDESALMETMASHAAQALDRAEAYVREVAARGRVEVLKDLSEALSKALSVDDVARAAIDLGIRAARADTCTLYRLEASSRELVLIGERGCHSAVVDRIRRITAASGNPVYESVVTGQSHWVETWEEYRAFSPELTSLALEGPRATAFWSVPLLAEGRAIGLLGMGYHGPHRFSPEERAFIETFARQCAEALLRAGRLEAEREARALAEQLRASLSTTLRSIGDAVIATDVRGAITVLNPVAEALTGWSEAEALGRPLGEIFRIVDGSTHKPVPDPVDAILERGAAIALADHTVLLARGGREVPIDDSSAPIRGESGVIEGVVLVFRDVTEKKRDEGRRAFLADATAALTQSLDYEATLRKVTQLVVPTLADWCAVDIVQDGDRRPKRLAIAHVDPEKVKLARALEERYPPNLDAKTGMPNVLRTGEAELYADIPDELLVASSVDEDHLRIARELGLKSAMVVPLSARGRTLGAMTFVYAESGRRYTDDDLRFAREIAHRCAVAIDNARLFISEQQARLSADVANRAKDEFLAVVSHELRTPLNAIMGWAKIMASRSLDDHRRERAVETIERNAVAMAQLIEDLLDMSRIISGKMRLDVQRMDVAPVVEAAIESIRPAADAKDIRITSLFDTRIPSLIGDPARLQQVVWNLLSNAVKFTGRGGRVEVVMRQAASWAEITVSDTGKGIAPRFLPYVFHPFRQEDASPTRARGGLGLGLAITRQLVELHGGRIEVRSEGDARGSTFVVYLPISAVARATAAAESAERPARIPAADRGTALQGLHILVVDDEKDARHLVRTILEDCGCRVTTAAGVDDALDALAREVPDALVSDIGMPDRDGFELIRHVRALPRERGGDMPAAALTAYARAEDRLRMLTAGYSMHLAKPIDPAELVVVVASLTRFTQRARA